MAKKKKKKNKVASDVLDATMPPKKLGAILERQKWSSPDKFTQWAGVLMYVKAMETAEVMWKTDLCVRNQEDYLLYEGFWVGFIPEFTNGVLEDKDFPFPAMPNRSKMQIFIPIFNIAFKHFMLDHNIQNISSFFVPLFEKLQQELVNAR